MDHDTIYEVLDKQGNVWDSFDSELEADIAISLYQDACPQFNPFTVREAAS